MFSKTSDAGGVSPRDSPVPGSSSSPMKDPGSKKAALMAKMTVFNQVLGN